MNLTTNVLFKIFLQLDPKSLLSAFQVCKKWYSINKLKWFWHNKVLTDFEFDNTLDLKYKRVDYAICNARDIGLNHPGVDDDITDYCRLFDPQIIIGKKLPYILFQEKSLRYFTQDFNAGLYGIIDLDNTDHEINFSNYKLLIHVRALGFNMTYTYNIIYNSETKKIPFTKCIICGNSAFGWRFCIPLYDTDKNLNVISLIISEVTTDFTKQIGQEKAVTILSKYLVSEIYYKETNTAKYYGLCLFLLKNIFHVNFKNWRKHINLISKVFKVICLIIYYCEKLNSISYNNIKINKAHKKNIKKLGYKNGTNLNDIDILLNYIYENKIDINKIL